MVSGRVMVKGIWQHHFLGHCWKLSGVVKVSEVKKTPKTMTFTNIYKLELCAWKWWDNPVTLRMRS